MVEKELENSMYRVRREKAKWDAKHREIIKFS